MREPILECVRCETVEGVEIKDGTVTIKGVRLLGEKSQNPPPNNHEYPRSTREKAIALLEGMQVKVDHPPRTGQPQTRSYRDGMGLVKGVTEKGDGLYGNWSFSRAHPLAEQAIWDARHNPKGLGFSINGNGDKSREGGRVIVEEITDLESIDLVSRPATTGGLFEGRITVTKKRVGELRESLKIKRPGYSRALKEMADSGIMSDDAMMDEPPAEPVAGGESKDHEQALRDAAKAVLDDDKLSAADMVAKIKKILGIINGGGDKAGKGETETKTETETETEESKKRAQAGNLLENKALLAFGREGIKITPLIESAIRGCRTEQEVTALVESCKSTPARPGARSSAGSGTDKLQEQRQGQQQQREDTPEARQKRVREMRAIR